MSENPASESTPVDDSIFGPSKVTQILILAAATLFCFVFYFGARAIRWPAEPGFQGSLSQSPVAFGGLFTAIFLLAACTIAGTWALGRRWFMAGLMTATAGLATWSVRGGPMTFVLFRADSSGVHGGIYLAMLFELIIFYGVIGCLWNWIWTSEPAEKFAAESEGGRSTAAAIAVQIVLMTVFSLILVATTQKKQVMTGLFVAGLFSTAIAEQFFADAKTGRWYWLGPLVAGAFGYIANFLSPGGFETGDPTGTFGALARALPLDYASMGCAGALLGYWWMSPEEVVEEESAADR